MCFVSMEWFMVGLCEVWQCVLCRLCVLCCECIFPLQEGSACDRFGMLDLFGVCVG